MVEHRLRPSLSLSWRGMAQLVHRDLQVDACCRLLLVRCGLNRRHFTRFQVRRLHRLEGELLDLVAAPELDLGKAREHRAARPAG